MESINNNSRNLGRGQFYGQKGGLLDDASSVLQFDGEFWPYHAM